LVHQVNIHDKSGDSARLEYALTDRDNPRLWVPGTVRRLNIDGPDRGVEPGELEDNEMFGISSRETVSGRRIMMAGVFLVGIAAGAAIAPFASLASGEPTIASLPSESAQVAMNAAALMAIASLSVDSEIATRGLVSVRGEIASLEKRIRRLEEKLPASPDGRN
jgi:hypothetical protein